MQADALVNNYVNTATLQNTASAARLTLIDQFLAELNHAAKVLNGTVAHSRVNPADIDNTPESDLSAAEIKHAAGLMRVNHVGEICAQALYRGQALMCNDEEIRQLLLKASDEEVDHLAWCHARLREFNSRPSIFNPLWYLGSIGLGVLASKAGIGYNLGFMAETERQVEQHLNGHLQSLPIADARSRKIVTQMRDDEIGHRTTAEDNGAVGLPAPVRFAMKFMSKIMTTTAYRV